MTHYLLPELPYDYGELEPHISAEILELHHDKHHRAYVDGANEAIDKLIEARKKKDFTHIAALQKKLAFNVSGHVLHSIFWQNLSPDGGGEPTGDLARAIERDFSSFDSLKEQMNAVAASIMGSGWSALVWDPIARRLGTSQIHDHQSEITQGGVPLLVIDAWEHAYYLQYKNDKKKFFEAIWNLWNWDDVATRFELASRLDLSLSNVAEDLLVPAAKSAAPSPNKRKPAKTNARR
jgi:Fe-Mn family superoxide dismutase